MSRGLKILFTSLLFLIAILAASTGFFYSKTLSLQKNSTAKTTTPSTSATKTVDDSKTTTAVTSSDSTATTAAPLNNRPSSPSDTVKVEQGETLFSIGQKVGVSWTILAEVNGINADSIKAGETIIIPKNNQVGFTVNQDKAKSLQTDIDGGKYAFRLSATETAKSDSSPVYGLTPTDTYTEKTIDATAGTATISATKDGKTYLISLVQPINKGAKGIWVIESIKLSSQS